MIDSWDSWLVGTLIPQIPPLITTPQTLAPNAQDGGFSIQDIWLNFWIVGGSREALSIFIYIVCVVNTFDTGVGTQLNSAPEEK